MSSSIRLCQFAAPLLFALPLSAAWMGITSQSMGADPWGITSAAFQYDTLVWGATNGGGVVYFDGSEWDVLNHGSTPLANDNVHVVCVAADLSGSVWFGTQMGATVLRSDGSWASYSTMDGLPSNRIDAVVVDSTGLKWFGTPGGIARFNDVSFTVYTADSGVSSDVINALAVGPGNTIWAATVTGLLKYDGSTWTTYDSSDGLPSGVVHDVIVDRAGVVWLATADGLARFVGSAVTDTIDNPDANGSNVFNCVREDGAGILWLGTQTSGVLRYVGSTLAALDVADGLLDNTVTTIAISRGQVRCFGGPLGFTMYSNDTPVIAALTDTNAQTSTPWTRAVTAVDANTEDRPTFALTSAPSGMTVDTGTGVISWTPSLAQVGQQTVALSVTDPYGSVDRDTFDVTVQPPVLARSTVSSPCAFGLSVSRGSGRGATIRCAIAQPRFVRVEVLDAAGRTVAVPVSGMQHAGVVTATWAGTHGAFVCRMVAGSFVQTKTVCVAD